MPCEYRTYGDENLLVKRFAGRITKACVLDLLDSVEADKSYVEGMVEFDDLREVTEIAISARDIAAFADLIKGINHRRRQPKRKAVLAPFDFARQAAETLRAEAADVADLQVGIFSDFDEALRYLGLENKALIEELRTARLKVH